MTESSPISAPSEKLLKRLLIRFGFTVIIVGGLVFATAGSFRYWNGWLFMAALFGPMMPVVVYLYVRHRTLLEKRLTLREKQKEQKAYVKLSLLWFLVTFALPGFDYRLGWSDVPVWLVVASAVVIIIGYVLFIVAMVQNSFASRVIELQAEQRVIDTGLYSLVCHPMYMAASLMYAPCPLVLGSYYALIPTILLPLLLAFRIQNEEKLLRGGLAGYSEYANRVRYRLIPFVW